MKLPAGSMGPKVAAACEFASTTKNEAVIGSLADIDTIVTGSAVALLVAKARDLAERPRRATPVRDFARRSRATRRG